MGLLRFLLVGGVSALIQFIVLALCLEFLVLGYQLSAALAYVASVVFHFSANRYFTFQLKGVPGIDEIRRYATIVVVNFMVTMGITTLTVEVIKLTPYIATVFSIAATVGIAFISSKYWIFKKRESA